MVLVCRNQGERRMPLDVSALERAIARLEEAEEVYPTLRIHLRDQSHDVTALPDGERRAPRPRCRMTAPPLDLTPEQWRIVREILRRHVPDRAVWAFGSRVKGTARR